MHLGAALLFRKPLQIMSAVIVAVVTDHGHKPEGGHGGDSPAERQSFLMARGLGRKNPEWNEKIEPFHVAKLLLQELN